MSEKNVPNVRFKGFSESWEQRQLGEYVVDYVEKTTIPNQFPVLTSSQQQGVILQEDYFTNRQVTTNDNIGYFILPRGYFTYRSRSDNDVFVFNRNDIIDKGIISYFYPVFSLKNADSDFFLKRVNNGIQRQLSIQAEGTGQHVLSLKKFKNIDTLFPIEIEQVKIGKLLNRIDQLIASNQRKLDQLKEVKKLLMQKIFDQEWRFEGFTDPWEQRQLGKIVDERKERSSQGELLSVTMHDGIKKSSTLDKKDNSSDNKSNYKVVCQGDIAYNSMRMWQGASGLSMFNGIVSPAYTVLKIGTSIDGSFLSYLFKRSEMIWMFRTHSQGLTSDTWNLKYPALSKIKIEYPILNEQIRISTFLKNFDQLIASNQQKLDQLKEMKKWFMQNMFV